MTVVRGSAWSTTSVRRRAGGVLGIALMIAGSVTLLAPATATAMQHGSSGPDVPPDPEPSSSTRALALLEQLAGADGQVRYSGTQFVSAWGTEGTSSTLVDVQNEPGRGTAYRVRGSDGAAAGDIVTTASDVGAQLAGGPVGLVSSSFTVETAGRDKVTGRTTRVLELTGADDLVAARLWMDVRTGVLLRREVYDGTGRTVRASAFVALQVDHHTEVTVTAQHPPVAPVSSSAELSDAEVTDLRDEGCACPDVLAGRLSLFRVGEVRSSTGTALQLSYSDGLSTVSVFEQPGSVDAAAMAGYTRIDGDHSTHYVGGGPLQRVVWSAGDVVYSIVADAPTALVDQVVSELPQDTPEPDGVTDRIGRGLHRVGSWVNPFG